MAEKRMFSKQIIDSDAFLDMPLSTQALYFHLNMRADDDGFIDSPKKIMKMIGCSGDDLKILLGKRYILSFESGVIVIKHWRIHNTLQKDRYKETTYLEEKSLLELKKNKSYTENRDLINVSSEMFPNCIQNVSKVETQIRLDKNSIDKDISCSPEDERLIASKENFEKIYALYPKKTGKAKALEYYMQWRKGRKLSGFDKAIKLTNKQMYLATMKYVAEKKDTETDLQYYKGFDVFMNKAILDYVEGRMNEAEKGVIGCVLVDSECLYEIYDKLKPNMFSDGFCSDCFTEMLAMYDNGINITPIELSQRLETRKHDKEDISKFLKECVNDCPTSVYVKNYANTIIDNYRARTVRNLFEHISLLPKDINESIAEIMARCEELSECKDIRSKSISKIVDEQQDKYFLNIEREYVTTGFSKLDDCLICLEGGDVTVIGARPSVGKSAISLQMIEHICGCGKKVGYFNLEMGEEQVFQRLNSRFSKIGITRIRRAKEFLNDEQERYRKANDKMKSLNLIVSAGSKTVSEIKNESRHQKFDVIVIDYLQLIKADRINANRAAEVGYISKSIKELAMELKVPVILLSQLNRVSERSETKEPTMADLRESGDIEQDASNIILLWKMVDDGSLIGLKVDKNRQGGLMKEGLSFVGDTVSFTERGEDFSETLKLAKRTDGFSDAGRTPFD